MNFEVNGIRYILTFVAEEGDWALLTPTQQGVRRIEVENDDETRFINPLMMDTDEELKKIVN